MQQYIITSRFSKERPYDEYKKSRRNCLLPHSFLEHTERLQNATPTAAE